MKFERWDELLDAKTIPWRDIFADKVNRTYFEARAFFAKGDIYNAGKAMASHAELKKNHSRLCGEVDLPIAGLIRDLKQRGLLNETMVVIGTEFGRTPGVEGQREGRDHHPFGFSVIMAGGGLKGGIAHGATDELGFHAVENRHYVTDIHATILHQMGLDPHKLEVPGHKRLEIDYGAPIREIIA